MNGVIKKRSRYCSVPSCNGLSSTIFHKFPKNDDLKQEWINTCNITKPLTNNSSICGSHFTKEDYMCGNKRLNATAIPSKNLIHGFEEFIPEEELYTTECSPTLIQNDVNLRLSESEQYFENIVEFVPVEDEDVAIIDTDISQSKRIISNITIDADIKRCCIPHCDSIADDKTYLHYFPKQKNLKQLWKNACRLDDDEKTKSLTVCSGHFKKTDYITDPKFRKSVLKATAVPSLNLHNDRKRRLSTPEIEIITNEDKNVEGEEKVTTIIYVPANCKEIITMQSNNSSYGIVKNNTSNSLLKKNQNSQISNVQKNVTESVPNESPASHINSEITPDQNTHKSKRISKSKTVVNNADASNENTKVVTRRQKSKRKRVTKEKDNLTTVLNNIDFLKNTELEKYSMTAIASCIECCQEFMVDVLNYSVLITKNVETIAGETLLELQEIKFSSEQERTLLTKIGIEICDKTIQKQRIDLMDLLQNDNELEAFTGINLEILDKLTKLIIQLEGDSTSLYTSSVKERIVISLCKLRTNLPFRSIGVLFGISEKDCIDQFFAMIETLSTLLEKTIYWTKTEELLKKLPKRFQSFKQTRVILNSSEMQVEKQRCEKCQLKVKRQDYDAIKLILGIAPSGLIILKSNVYKDETSDISVFEQTKILDYIDPSKDAIMSDKSLNIEDECVEHNIILIKLPKLEKNKRFSKADVEVIKNIAAARIHVERTIQRFRLYKILEGIIPLRILPYLDDICTIIAGVVNMKNPIPPNELKLSDFLKDT